jgi:hypothetical protein
LGIGAVVTGAVVIDVYPDVEMYLAIVFVHRLNRGGVHTFEYLCHCCSPGVEGGVAAV